MSPVRIQRATEMTQMADDARMPQILINICMESEF